jgi:hypothetical protein
MSRWVAVTLGCITALGMQALLTSLAPRVSLVGAPLAGYGGMFLALVFAGYVTGHLVGRWHAFNGALAAAAYIMVVATLTALREANTARDVGVPSLAPIDYLQLATSDFVALTGAALGGWLAGLLAPDGARGSGV